MFTFSMQEQLGREAPLAARMRPRTLDEFIGQEHILGPGRLLRRAIQADQLSSLIFYGPPGTGKTTLAMVIANTTKSHFITINAVLAGVKDIRAAISEAQERRGMYNQRTILFIDEVHRFNKAQQDALLPWVENGTILMIGATTENPWFSVNPPLTSRSRIFQLKPLTENDLREVARCALEDKGRGYGSLLVELYPDALEHLVNVANGDARSLLNALELAVETTPPDTDGRINVDMAVAEESIQRRAVLYDKEGDYHFDTISAFIKSMRGSDPDATMYWLAKMVYAGEESRFIFRRMLIFACEDVGLADPQAILVVNACAEAFERVGLPEGRFHLAEAALYLATAPKSNSAFAFFDALRLVEEEREGEVPAHLKDASRDKEGFGHGEGYLYPHAYRDHWVAQGYLPDSLKGRLFYQPGEVGYEAQIRDSVLRRREAQLAAALEFDTSPRPEVLTFSPADKVRERWLQRTVSGLSVQLEALRQRIFEHARVQRHHLVLDLNAGSGLLTWEALRLTPEGNVWCLVDQPQMAELLRQQASHLPQLSQPVIMVGSLDQLEALVGAQGFGPVKFDIIIGRNTLARFADKKTRVLQQTRLLAEAGTIVLAEIIPGRAQRLSGLIDLSPLGNSLSQRIRQAEESIYCDPRDPLVNWDSDDVEEAFASFGLEIRTEMHIEQSSRQITSAQLARWFDPAPAGERKSYADRLLASGLLSRDELNQYRQYLTGIVNTSVMWPSTYLYVVAKGPGQRAG